MGGLRRRRSRPLGAEGFNYANTPGLFASFFGNTGLALVGGEVDVWADQTLTGSPAGAQDLMAVVAGQRPLPVSGSPNLNGADSVSFVATDKLRAMSSIDWVSQHDGLGGSYVLVWYSNTVGLTLQTLLDTSNASTVTRGIWVAIDNRVGQGTIRVYITNGAAACLAYISPTGTVTLGQSNILVVRFLTGRLPFEIDVRLNGIELVAQNAAFVPSPAAPGGALAVGASTSSSSFPATAEIPLALFCSEAVPDDVVLAIEAQASADFAIP